MHSDESMSGEVLEVRPSAREEDELRRLADSVSRAWDGMVSPDVLGCTGKGDFDGFAMVCDCREDELRRRNAFVVRA